MSEEVRQGWKDVTNKLRQEPEKFEVTLQGKLLPDGRMLSAGYVTVMLGHAALDSVAVDLAGEKFICDRESVERWLAKRNPPVRNAAAELDLRLNPPPAGPGYRPALLQSQDVATVYEILDIVAKKPGLSRDRGLVERLELLRQKLDCWSTPVGNEDDYIRDAELKHARDGEVEIDADALVSVGDVGAWVSAWVFVKRPPKKKRKPKP